MSERKQQSTSWTEKREQSSGTNGTGRPGRSNSNPTPWRDQAERPSAPGSGSGTELAKTYDPQEVEGRWYAFWMEHRLFHAEADPSRPPFSMVIPPPNVTGQLHMGHALDNTMQDIFVRWQRMKGKNAVWIPGTDHAGIATQAKVEEELAKQGLSRYDLGREKFLEKVWEWKENYGHRIVHQLQRLGSSCDWERERFTMDAGCSRAVREVFKRLYDKGLIYQGDYIINWCPRCRTAISDIEVDHEDVQADLYYLRYPLVPKDTPGVAGGADGDAGAKGRTRAGVDAGVDGGGKKAGAQAGAAGSPGQEWIVVATTRPETMLGDTGVAVHPDDDRYHDLVGRQVRLPLVNRVIPIFADSYVDPTFGTGAVKVTPAHDPNDFDMAQRHGLPAIRVIDEDANMMKSDDVPAAYRGLSRDEARRRVLKDLQAQGYLVKTEPLTHAVGHCSRCGTIVEPLLSKQWFVRMKPLAGPALAAVREGRVRFVPERFTTLFVNWVENVRDWCISRQLWWGHRIPVWTCSACGHQWVALDDPQQCPRCGATVESGQVRQDPDVLDTWFSSALWPFSTMGWPEKTPELAHWYPTSLLVTGFDIIFFWVARMVFMGLEFMGDVPFHTVLIHGLVRDALGRKMSKSLGNGIDPLDVVDRYGADALRFTLVNGVGPGNDMRYVPERVEASRNFANKIWNATRFALMNLEGFEPADTDMVGWLQQHASELSLADRWILARWNRATAELERHLERFDLGEAARVLYDFIWDELCDWYIEMCKPRLYQQAGPEREATRQVLWFVLRSTLEMLHPFMPFITEELWQKLPRPQAATAAGRTTQPQPISIMIAPWPQANSAFENEVAEEQVSLVQQVVTGIRNLRAELQVQPGRRIPAIFHAERSAADTLRSAWMYVETLAGLDSSQVTWAELGAERPRQAVAAVVPGVEVYLPLAGLVDLAAERARLRKELEQAQQEAAKSEKRLANAGFVQKAPAEVVERERERLARYQETAQRLTARLRMLEEE
ncbi:MAG: valine--tRNA ligase [Limnochordaceae bacterium]|nr:valine--tRNA ligase [Limnochordaceae bacterium]